MATIDFSFFSQTLSEHGILSHDRGEALRVEISVGQSLQPFGLG